MQKTAVLSMGVIFSFVAASGAPAAQIGLFDWAFNDNGDFYSYWETYDDPIDLPGNIDYSGFHWDSGLGTITITYGGEGVPGSDYSLRIFFDHDIEEDYSGYFPEFGATGGAEDSHQSWEIDKPGCSKGASGDSYQKVKDGAPLGEVIDIPAAGDDISMAMGWDFSLPAGDMGVITLTVSETAPSSGFFMAQYDWPDAWPGGSPPAIYFWGSLNIATDEGSGEGTPIPEPCTMLLLGTGLASLAGFGKMMQRP